MVVSQRIDAENEGREREKPTFDRLLLNEGGTPSNA